LYDLIESFSGCANFPLGRGYPKRVFARAKNAMSENLISLRPLRLCGKYSEFGCGSAALG
jgi:hypothetical protein